MKKTYDRSRESGNAPLNLSDVDTGKKGDPSDDWEDGQTISVAQWRSSSYGKGGSYPSEGIEEEIMDEDASLSKGKVVPASEKDVLVRWQAKCSKREYCTTDVRRKAVLELGGDEAAAERVVQGLVDEKYLDDFRYASAYARDKSSLSGWGRVKISVELQKKGIERGVIAKALEEIDCEKATVKMDSVLRNKWKSIRDDPRSKFKLIEFGLRRGYAYDEIKPLVDELYNEYLEEHRGEGPSVEEFDSF